MGKLSQRQANKIALQTAAALIEGEDLEGLFADLYTKNLEDEDTVEILDNAQKYVVARIRKLIE